MGRQRKEEKTLSAIAAVIDTILVIYYCGIDPIIFPCFEVMYRDRYCNFYCLTILLPIC